MRKAFPPFNSSLVCDRIKELLDADAGVLAALAMNGFSFETVVADAGVLGETANDTNWHRLVIMPARQLVPRQDHYPSRQQFLEYVIRVDAKSSGMSGYKPSRVLFTIHRAIWEVLENSCLNLDPQTGVRQISDFHRTQFETDPLHDDGFYSMSWLYGAIFEPQI